MYKIFIKVKNLKNENIYWIVKMSFTDINKFKCYLNHALYDFILQYQQSEQATEEKGEGRNYPPPPYVRATIFLKKS
jgi:hypothetical protein